MKKYAKYVLFSIITTVVFFAVIEGVFRLIFGAPLNFDERTIPRNRLALRDLRPPHKAVDTTQILLLGDSYTFGYGVEIKDSYPAILEQLLNGSAVKPKYEVINTAQPGNDTITELRWLKVTINHYSPKWVVVALTPNDIIPELLVPRIQAEETRPRKNNFFINQVVGLRYHHSTFIAVLYKWYKSIFIKYVPPPKDYLSFDAADLNNAELMRAEEKYLKEIQAIAQDHNAKMLIFMVVPLINWEIYPYRAFHKIIENFSKDNGIYYVDSLLEFSKHDSGKLWVAANDDHYNPEGNRIAAGVLFKFFKGQEQNP